MIAHLTGHLVWKGEDSLVLDTGGVGYLVSVPAPLLRGMEENTPLSLWIETLVREDAINLYGFDTLHAQQLFRLLLSVQGVGARVALALLAAFPSEILAHLLFSQDKKTLLRADGVGPKLAERLVLELKDKMLRHLVVDGTPARPSGADHGSPGGTPGELLHRGTLLREAQEALAFLGYRPFESVPVLEACLQDAGSQLPLLDGLIKHALSRLSPREARE